MHNDEPAMNATGTPQFENEILSYLEMCRREGLSLQRGMNFSTGRDYSIILMSRRPGAPYADDVRDDGQTLIYEGHDVPKGANTPNPKSVDQEALLPSGKLTQNGKFKKAAEDAKRGVAPAAKVRVYEKIRDGIWSYNGLFALVDCWAEQSGGRSVFKFKLLLIEEDANSYSGRQGDLSHHRIIPTDVKLTVWKRDSGKCVVCNATDNLHFDHVIPFSKGGSSVTADNVQLLCCRHNLEKRDKIL